MKKYDSIMIGFGKGAKTLAADLAGRGEKVAVVEKSDKMYGGTCINVGCIPTKSLVNSANIAAITADNGNAKIKRELYAKAIAEKNRLTAMLRKKNFEKLDSLSNIDVILGEASFIDGHTLSIETPAGTEEIFSEKIFINSGSYPFVPPIAGLDTAPNVFTSETLMELSELPSKLTIIGGGYIGLEFASIYSSFGAKVTVLQSESEFMPRDDRDIADAIFADMSERVDFRLGVKILSVKAEGDKPVVTYERNGAIVSILSDAVLVATGRRPNTERLKAENAGVMLERGAVKTDKNLKTTADNIWAMGDCKGGLMFTYISLDDYRIVKSSLEGDGSRTTENRGAISYSVFMNPPYSHVGLTEREAVERGYNVRTAKLSAAAIPKAQVLKKPVGLLKAVVDADTDKILGVSIFAEESYETINIVKLAIDFGLPYTALKDCVFTHPTMSESLNDLFGGIKK